MSLQDTLDGIADAVSRRLAGEVPGVQVYAGLNPNPTPPSIDVYPADPFLTGAGFGTENMQAFFTVRARVSTADHQAGNRLLLRLLDPGDPASVQAAVEDADTATVTDGGVSGLREYVEDASDNGRLLGCEWRVTSYL